MHENKLAMWAEGMPGEESCSLNTGKLCSFFSQCFPGTAGIRIKRGFQSAVWHAEFMHHLHPARAACVLVSLGRS